MIHLGIVVDLSLTFHSFLRDEKVFRLFFRVLIEINRKLNCFVKQNESTHLYLLKSTLLSLCRHDYLTKTIGSHRESKSISFDKKWKSFSIFNKQTLNFRFCVVPKRDVM